MTTTSPLAGVRVLELSTGQAARTAGMLLADLGADVVRGGSGGGTVPEELVWDRGKRITDPADGSELLRLALAADVVLDDGATLEATTLLARSPTLVHVAMPAYGAAGRWRDLAQDPLLVTALGGFAAFHPSYDPGTPVASAVPMVSAIHGALGALLAAAGVLGVRRGHGGRALETTGLHASAACLASLVVEGIDAPDMVTPDGRVGSRPSFRTYRCADGRYLHLSTLTVEFFLPALTALDRMDVMVLPGVDGDFLSIMRPDIGRLVGAELERTFADRPRDEWLEILTDAGVPCAPVLPREEWLTSDIVAATAPPTTLEHPDLGPVVLPGAPWALSGAAPAIRHLGSATAHTVPASSLWREQRAAAAPSAPADLPLTGLRVIDLSTFFAAPFSAALLADLGATVVKVEPPRGDPYSVFTASYAAVNHAKTLATVDLRDDSGRARFTELVAQADVLVDNLRPAAAGRLGVTDDVLTTANPRLVRGSVSAFGRSGPFADLPGFDPVLQSRSGLAAAQGGADEPVPTSAPTIDVATGVVTAVGLLAALVERETTGGGGHVTTSLAATSTFLQAAELVAYEGHPPTEQGGRDYRGPEPARRFHRAADGWLALAASTDPRRETVRQVLGLESLTHEAVAATLATRPVEHWITTLGEHGIPVCTVAPRDGFLTDPYLAANDYAHVVRDPRLGRFRLARGYFRPVSPGPAGGGPGAWPAVRDLTDEVRPGFAVVPDPNGEIG